jgi:hypothetical protein
LSIEAPYRSHLIRAALERELDGAPGLLFHSHERTVLLQRFHWNVAAIADVAIHNIHTIGWLGIASIAADHSIYTRLVGNAMTSVVPRTNRDWQARVQERPARIEMGR